MAFSEIVVVPYAFYTAPYGESFPAVDAAPAGNWDLLGQNGIVNYEEAGITVTHEQTVNEIFGAGATGILKVSRQQERSVYAVTVQDVRLEIYTRLINNTAPTTVAPGSGTVGTKAISLNRGLVPYEFALLVRGVGATPYDVAGANAQYEIPRCYIGGNQSVQYGKGSASMLAMEFTAMYDPNSPSFPMGRLIVVSAAALP